MEEHSRAKWGRVVQKNERECTFNVKKGQFLTTGEVVLEQAVEHRKWKRFAATSLLEIEKMCTKIE